jgi:hypothetical protein
MYRTLAVTILFATLGCAIARGGTQAEGRYLNQRTHPEGYTVVIAEGEFEPRSVGSYSIRVYADAGSGIPTDHFVCGIIRPRDGVVEDVFFADVDGDGRDDTVVTTRCVGTGSFLSADAFTFTDERLRLLASVSGLPKDADCLDALRKAVEEELNQQGISDSN